MMKAHYCPWTSSCPFSMFFIASGSGFWFVLQPRACVCIRQVPQHLCLRYQTCKVERSQTTELDAKVSSTKLDASENCFNLQMSYMKGERPGTNQQAIPGRRACLGILPITTWPCSGLPGSTCIYAPLTSADEEIITSATTTSNDRAGFISPFEHMPRGEHLVIWRTALSFCLLYECFGP